MPNAAALALYAVRGDIAGRHRICTLSARAAGLHVGFAPELGMVACSCSTRARSCYPARFTIAVERQS
jgi:hypothetical protein